MGSVMIRCPNTGRAVSTAIETEPAVFRKIAEGFQPDALSGLRRGACLVGNVRLARGEPRLVERQKIAAA